MISLEKSLEKRKTFYKMIFANQTINTVADLGCGSGLDSLALASLGLKVTAFDASAKMIRAAKQNGDKLNLKISFHRKAINDIPAKFTNRFNCVVSFGNTFANLNQLELKAALKKASQLLRPNGLLVFQLLNYARIEKKKEAVIGFTEKEDNLIIRFNEFLKDNISFHFLTINKKSLSSSIHYTTKIYPHKQKFISNLLMQNNFLHRKYYGNLLLEKFNSATSKDLIVIAKN